MSLQAWITIMASNDPDDRSEPRVMVCIGAVEKPCMWVFPWVLPNDQARELLGEEVELLTTAPQPITLTMTIGGKDAQP